MTQNLIFDAGPIITLATNNLLDLLDELKKDFEGEFYITESVRKEVIDNPLKTKKFRFEAIQILKKLEIGIIKVYPNNLDQTTNKLLDLSNHTYFAHDNPITIVHFAEMEVIAAAIESGSDTIVIDERTARVLVENPLKIKERLQKKLHTKITVNQDNLRLIKGITGKINVIRSFELATVSYEKGYLDKYLVNLDNAKKELLEGVLWGVKLQGCSVSEDEINQIIKLEKLI